MLKKYLLSFIFILSGLLANSQPYNYDMNKNCTQAFQHILLLKLDSAKMEIEKEKEQHPENRIPFLLSNYVDILSIILHEDEEAFHQYKDLKKKRLEEWRKGPENSPWYLSGQAQIKLQWAFARVLFDEYFTAATEINSAYHLLEENKKLHPDFLVDNMGIGILHAMIGVVPEQYQWAMELFGLYGSIEQGLEEIKLQLETDSENVFSKEALFYYTFIRLNLKTDTTRINELLHFYQKDEYAYYVENSPILHFAKAVVLLKKDNDAAITFLEKSPSHHSAISFYYPTFLLGQSLLYRLDADAENFLNKYIENYPGKNFKKTALQRLAWWHFIQSDTIAYREKMQEISYIGAAVLDGDKVAAKESENAEDGYLPNVYLLRSRMLFDGHYFSRALKELNRVDAVDFDTETRLEFYYRKARILHEMDSITKAETAYLLALQYGADSDRYYAAKSALKLGEIAEQENDFPSAVVYYKKVLDLDFDEYRKGIRAKAKAGLQRVDVSNN